MLAAPFLVKVANAEVEVLISVQSQNILDRFYSDFLLTRPYR